jgi:hypothetical protein
MKSFDPAPAASTATATAAPPKRASTRKGAQSSAPALTASTSVPIPEAAAGIVEAEQRRHAELLAGAYAVLHAVADRAPNAEAAAATVTPTELEIIKRAGLNRSEHRFQLAALISRVQSDLAMRDELGPPSRLKDLQGKHVAALQSEQETRAVLDDLAVDGDDAGPALARQMGKLAKKLDALHAERLQAEAAVARAQSIRATLESHAPEPLRAAVELALFRFSQTALGRRSIGIDSGVRELERLIDPKNNDGLRTTARSHTEANGTLTSLLTSRCPDALSKNSSRQTVINWPKVEQLAKAIESEELPALRVEAVEIKRRAAVIVAKCREPLVTWATGNGVLTADAIVAAEALAGNVDQWVDDVTRHGKAAE